MENFFPLFEKWQKTSFADRKKITFVELQAKSWENKRLWFLSQLLPIDKSNDVSCAYSSALWVGSRKRDAAQQEDEVKLFS